MFKKDLLILAPHDLVLDPRVKWMSESLLSRFHITVFSLDQVSRDHGFDSQIKAVKLKPIKVSILELFRIFFRYFSLKYCFVGITIFILFLIFLPIKVLTAIVKLIFQKSISSNIQLKLRRFHVVRLFSDIDYLYYLARHFSIVICTFHKYLETDEVKYSYILANDLDTLIPALILKKKHDAQIIYDAHEFYPFQYPQTTWLMPWCLSFIEKRLICEVNSFITVTPQLATVIKKHYNYDKEIHVIPNCAPVEDINLRVDDNSKKVFLFLGNFLPGRGIEKLIRMWSEINPPNSILLLKGPDCFFKAECEDLARSLGRLGRDIFFEGPVAESELIQTAAKADVGLIPYDAISINNLNCCPNKLSQYLQSGIAVLSNDLPFIADILDQSGAGMIFDINSKDSFKTALENLLSENTLKMKKQRARSFAISKYNWNIASKPVFNKIFGDL